MATFVHDGHRLAYTTFGAGERTVVLLHGLLLGQKMHRPLAKELAARGHRVMTLDLLGHGGSDRPVDMREYAMPAFAGQVVGLLDHLGVDQAVIAGTSLGANVTLEVAAAAPERVRGMVVEMPVLDNALLGCAIAFTPLMVALTFGEPGMKLVQRGARALPTRGLWLADVLLDTVRQDPAPSAAVLQGLFFQRVAPPAAVRRTLDGAGARDRPPPRPGAPVLGLRRARRRAAQRAAAGGRLDPRAAPQPRAADRRDRRLPGRVLAAGPDRAARGRLTPPRRRPVAPAQSRQAGASPR